MKKLFSILFILLGSACSFKLIQPTQSDVDRVSTKFPGYSLAELNEGKSLFEHTCNKCHHLKNPASRTEARWNKIVPKMLAKLNKREGKQMLDEKQQETLLRYLVTMSKGS